MSIERSEKKEVKSITNQEAALSSEMRRKVKDKSEEREKRALRRTIEEELEAKIVTTAPEALNRAVYKWVKFMRTMWTQIDDPKTDQQRKKYDRLGTIFRVTIIALSATVTTVSAIDLFTGIPLTIIAGVLTALTGIEAYFRFTERALSVKQQQRELQALRDELRYNWVKTVELEIDETKRIDAAKGLLVSGPLSYNSILNKYIFKSKEGDKPAITTAQP